MPADDPKKVWPSGAFVVMTSLFAIASAALIVCVITKADFTSDFTEGDGKGLPINKDGVDVARLSLAEAMTKPLLIAGALLVVAGAWMVIVEWRAQFVPATPPSAGDNPGVRNADAGSVIKELGSLKGGTLTLVAGVLLLFGPVWIGQSGASGTNAPAPAPTQSPTSTPTP